MPLITSSESRIIKRRAAATTGLPLDAYAASLYSAFGMRRYLTSWTGALIRVRRSTDGVESDIGYGADDLLDAAALASFLGAATGSIAVWYDQTTGARNMTQTTDGKRPGILSDKTGLTFDATALQWLRWSYTPAVGWSVAIKVSGITNAGFLLGHNNYNWSLIPNTASGVDWSYANADSYRTPALTSGVLALAGNQPYRNGATDGAALSGTPTFSGSTSIGSRFSINATTPYLTGNVHAVIFHNATWDASTAAGVSNAL